MSIWQLLNYSDLFKEFKSGSSMYERMGQQSNWVAESPVPGAVQASHLKCLVVSPSSYTNFTFIFWKPFCFRVAFNFFFFPELYKTKPNHNQRLLNLLPPPHQMFMVYSKPGVSMESLRDSLFFFFFAGKIRYLAHWRNPLCIMGLSVTWKQIWLRDLSLLL